MKNFNIKSRNGFTLIELLVVIGILAVLAAIAIPSVAGLIDRANVSADNTNANEMTNAIERFASEYELYIQDIGRGALNPNDLDSAQGRVYNVTGATTRGDITAIEKAQSVRVADVGDDVAIYRDTKYPVNNATLQKIVENYMKTSSSTFEPKQSDCNYYYSPDCGIVVCTETDKASTTDLNALVLSGKDAKGKTLGPETQWINVTTNESLLKELSTLTATTWEGLTSFNGSNIWKKDSNIYYSSGSTQYVLNNGVWTKKTWSGQNKFNGSEVFCHNSTYYASGGYLDGGFMVLFYTYKLVGNTWQNTTYSTSSSPSIKLDADYIWSDGINTYYSRSSSQLIFAGNSAWENKVWNGYNNIDGQCIWSDGTSYYYSQGNNQYVLNGDTWVQKEWNGLTNFSGSNVWTDGTNYYYSYGTTQYMLKGDTWVQKEWNGLTNFNGSDVWTDGANYYYSYGTTHYKFS